MSKMLKLALVASVAVAFLVISTGQPLSGDAGQAVDFKFTQSRKLGAFPYETLKGGWISCSGGSLKIEGTSWCGKRHSCLNRRRSIIRTRCDQHMDHGADDEKVLNRLRAGVNRGQGHHRTEPSRQDAPAQSRPAVVVGL